MTKNLPLLFVVTTLGIGITLTLNQLPEIWMWTLFPLSYILSIWGSIGLTIQLWVRYIKVRDERSREDKSLNNKEKIN